MWEERPKPRLDLLPRNSNLSPPPRFLPLPFFLSVQIGGRKSRNALLAKVRERKGRGGECRRDYDEMGGRGGNDPSRDGTVEKFRISYLAYVARSRVEYLGGWGELLRPPCNSGLTDGGTDGGRDNALFHSVFSFPFAHLSRHLIFVLRRPHLLPLPHPPSHTRHRRRTFPLLPLLRSGAPAPRALGGGAALVPREEGGAVCGCSDRCQGAGGEGGELQPSSFRFTPPLLIYPGRVFFSPFSKAGPLDAIARDGGATATTKARCIFLSGDKGTRKLGRYRVGEKEVCIFFFFLKNPCGVYRPGQGCIVAVLFFRLVVVGSHLDRLLLPLMFLPLALIREKATGEQCFQGLGEGGREGRERGEGGEQGKDCLTMKCPHFTT